MYTVRCKAGLRSVSRGHSVIQYQAILKSQESVTDWKRAEAEGAGPPRRRDGLQVKPPAPSHVLVFDFAIFYNISLPLFLLQLLKISGKQGQQLIYITNCKG